MLETKRINSMLIESRWNFLLLAVLCWSCLPSHVTRVFCATYDGLYFCEILAQKTFEWITFGQTWIEFKCQIQINGVKS